MYGRINGFEKKSIFDDFSRKKNKQNVIIITNLRFPESTRTCDDKTKIGEIIRLDTAAMAVHNGISAQQYAVA